MIRRSNWTSIFFTLRKTVMVLEGIIIDNSCTNYGYISNYHNHLSCESNGAAYYVNVKFIQSHDLATLFIAKYLYKTMIFVKVNTNFAILLHSYFMSLL